LLADVADEGAGVAGRALDPPVLAGVLADGLPPEELDCWSAAAESQVESFASLSVVVVSCAWTLGCGGPLPADPFAV
jgi:hypothetical protein